MTPNYLAALDAIEIGFRSGSSVSLASLGGKVAGALGFAWFHYQDGGGLVDVSNGPDNWSERYRAANYVATDPIRRRARLTRQVVIWSDRPDSEIDVDTRSFLEDSARHGPTCGLNIPIAAGFGREAALCFSDAAWASTAIGEYRSSMLYIVGARLDQLFVSIAQGDGGATELTGQELACLTWASLGKTMVETATIIGLQRRTVDFHLTNARRKLGAATVSQAVAEALRHKLIV